jgi:Ca-activated chloride channel homolog
MIFALMLLLAQTEPFQISVKVDLVVLHTTVRDRKGQFATDLRQRDFQVYEDGVRQSVRVFQHEDAPVTVGLVIDHSGSMRNKLPDVIAAARVFVQSSSTNDQMFVVNFNEKVTLGLPRAIPFSDRVDELAGAIARSGAEGQTALYDAIAVALHQLESGTREKKVLIVISDGRDNKSSHTLDEVLRTAEQTATLIYTIGIFDPDDQDRNPAVLRGLARATGGEAYFPAQLSAVIADCERIAHDIRHQYTIGYVSTKAAQSGGVHRSIRVTAASAEHGKLSVRARSGYITPGDRGSK